MSGRASSHWSRLDAAFAVVLELPEEERRPRLEQLFPDDPEAVEHVSRLLERESESRNHFDDLMAQRDRVLADVATRIEFTHDDPRIGARYGAWRIHRRIAAGGFSVVYEAHRDDGRYEQVVALKVIQGGLSADAVRHFLRERRILSTLDHPGIVRILDAGETATGAPWLAMDLAPGKPITQFCQDASLGLTERLTLVADIAEALQSAHARLIIHRDIKPDNIIVSEDGRARLLDFGVSSLMAGQQETERLAAMTPEYASPEQLQFGEITTASDIYQLGRVLSLLCEHCQPVSIDVRAVTEKATSPSPGARYDTASGLAQDLRRLVRGDPPLARPGTTLEAAARFMRRNKIASTLAIILLAGTVGWAATLSFHAYQMDQQRVLVLAAADRAERGRNVLLEIFRRMDPLEMDGVMSLSNSVEALVEPTLDDVRKHLFDDPQLQIELIGWAALLSERAGDEDRAIELADDVIRIFESSGDRGSSAYANAISHRGLMAIADGDLEHGNEMISRALSIARAAPLDDRNALHALIRAALANQGKWTVQRELFEEALPRMVAGTVNAEIEIRSGLGRSLVKLGQVTEAEQQLRLALARGEEAYGPGHPRLAFPLSELAQLLAIRGQVTESIAAHRRAYDLSVSAFGADYKSTLSHKNNLALALAEASETDEAIQLLDELIDTYERLDGSASRRVGEAYQNLATLQIREGRNDLALRSLELAEEILDVQLPKDVPVRAFPLLTRSEALLNLERFVEAQASAEKAFEILSGTLPAGHYAIEIARCRIGMALFGQGQPHAARSYITPALEALAQTEGAPARHLETCRSAGTALSRQTDP